MTIPPSFRGDKRKFVRREAANNYGSSTERQGARHPLVSNVITACVTLTLLWRRFPVRGKGDRNGVVKEVPIPISSMLDHVAEQPSLKSSGTRITRFIYRSNDEVHQPQ